MKTLETQDLVQRIQDLEKENSKLRFEADHDELTGCLRRQAIYRILDQQKNIGLLPSRCTVAIIDLDFFKRVNDTHGHSAGDQVLRFTAQNLRKSLPEGAMVARMGGEEFLVLLPMHIGFAERHMERIRLALANESLSLGNGQSLNVTLSCGLSEWNTDLPLDSAYQRADEKLYVAKHNGRNQVAA